MNESKEKDRWAFELGTCFMFMCKKNFAWRKVGNVSGRTACCRSFACWRAWRFWISERFWISGIQSRLPLLASAASHPYCCAHLQRSRVKANSWSRVLIHYQPKAPAFLLIFPKVLSGCKGYSDQHMGALWSQRTAPPWGGWAYWRCRSVWVNGSRKPSHRTCRLLVLTYGDSSSSLSAFPTGEKKKSEWQQLNIDKTVQNWRLTWDWISEILLQENSNSLSGTWTQH